MSPTDEGGVMAGDKRNVCRAQDKSLLAYCSPQDKGSCWQSFFEAKVPFMGYWHECLDIGLKKSNLADTLLTRSL